MFAWIPLCVGGCMGFAYLGLLWLSVKKFTKGKQNIPMIILGYFLRLGLVGISLLLIAKWFQFPGVLLYLLGFFLVRRIAKRQRIYGYHN